MKKIMLKKEVVSRTLSEYTQRLTKAGQEWTAQLERDKGRILKCPTNLELIMLNDELLKQVWYDSFTRHDVTDAEEFANVQGAIVNDESLEKMKKYIYEEYDLELSTDKIASALELTKRERARNPVEEYIRAEEWDGAPRVETLLIRYLGAEDSELNRAMTRKWMAAAVTRALEPGIKFDHVLMLAGSQGIGKSTFFATIGGKWFSDSGADRRVDPRDRGAQRAQARGRRGGQKLSNEDIRQFPSSLRPQERDLPEAHCIRRHHQRAEPAHRAGRKPPLVGGAREGWHPCQQVAA